MADKPIRAALYARVSTSDQTAENQLRDLRAHAQARGWSIHKEYVDEGISGAVSKRPALDDLMADANRRRFELVAVFRFDRFARSTVHLLSALSEFSSLGVGFVSLHEAIDTNTPLGRMVFTIVAAVAELEKNLIRERCIAGIRRAREDGVKFGRPRVGFDYKAAIALRDQGVSIRQIARQMGVGRSTVHRLLKTG